MKDLILAIDQGTSSTRVILFSRDGEIVKQAQEEFPQYYPQNGWVEHDPEEIWKSTLSLCHQVLYGNISRVSAIGITNQRETVVVWERNGGRAIHPAIVWMDRRTAPLCESLKARGHEEWVQRETGLLLDPYFSATKIAWILDAIPGARERAGRGELLCGTIDSFLLWRLTEGRVHATDATNASRTLLFSLKKGDWSDELCGLFDVPKELLPEVRDTVSQFGTTNLFGEALPITALVGDQQAALVGQGCTEVGTGKCTFGTGAFLVVNTGDDLVISGNRLLSTIAYRVQGRTTFACEGSVFIAGAAIQWLRDGLKLMSSAGESESLAREAKGREPVFFVPAFSGLGAPYWDAEARGALLGLTRDTGISDIVLAALNAVALQTRDLTEAMGRDGLPELSLLRVDGGMVQNELFVQLLADVLGATVVLPKLHETTALGAALLAGLGVGIFTSLDELKGRELNRIEPEISSEERDKMYRDWQRAVARVRG